MKLRLTLLAAMAGAPLAAQGIDGWDTDGDGTLGKAEFAQGVLDSGLFDEWDVDDDASIGYPELSDGLYGIWDQSDDGELAVEEWDRAVDLWFGESDVNLRVENWDENGNGVISQAEFASALEETDLLARLGGEAGSLDEDTLSQGLFDIADADDDDLVAQNEDSLLTDVAEFFTTDDELSAGATDSMEDAGDPQLIEHGEAFTQLPVPCGDGSGTCQDVAARFCTTLGYGDPIDYLDVDDQLYAIRCQDGI